ncbi:unnamed protein product [Polarella glacialis]|uniref:Uncharacterized protein n=1 Tax=Polarella glacialis TaxID=89957 RepID=A0A813EHC5_POLGL|nr:unnamed protein product [Polarella glacialis]
MYQTTSSCPLAATSGEQCCSRSTALNATPSTLTIASRMLAPHSSARACSVYLGGRQEKGRSSRRPSWAGVPQAFFGVTAR